MSTKWQDYQPLSQCILLSEILAGNQQHNVWQTNTYVKCQIDSSVKSYYEALRKQMEVNLNK